jgi:hypothetical protein
MARARKPRTVSVRIPEEDDKLARACAGLAGLSKPDWIGRAIREVGMREYPAEYRRWRRNRV